MVVFLIGNGALLVPFEYRIQDLSPNLRGVFWKQASVTLALSALQSRHWSAARA